MNTTFEIKTLNELVIVEQIQKYYKLIGTCCILDEHRREHGGLLRYSYDMKRGFDIFKNGGLMVEIKGSALMQKTKDSDLPVYEAILKSFDRLKYLKVVDDLA